MISNFLTKLSLKKAARCTSFFFTQTGDAVGQNYRLVVGAKIDRSPPSFPRSHRRPVRPQRAALHRNPPETAQDLSGATFI